MNISKLKFRVRRGDISPIEALDKLVLAERTGITQSPKLWKWVRHRMRLAQAKYGTHGHLRRRAL